MLVSHETENDPRSVLPFGSRRPTAGFVTAGITGAAALAVSFGAAQPAHAQVVIYNSGLTNTVDGSSIYFSASTGVSQLTSFSGSQYTISSYNNNGSPYASIAGTTNGTVNSLVQQNQDCYATRLAAGDLIDGFGASIITSPTIASANITNEPWNALGQGYLALQLQDSANTNRFFGWADITINPSYSVTLNRFALNATANQGVYAGTTNVAAAAAPEPDALALLALGAAGMGAYRLRLGKKKTDAE